MTQSKNAAPANGGAAFYCVGQSQQDKNLRRFRLNRTMTGKGRAGIISLTERGEQTLRRASGREKRPGSPKKIKTRGMFDMADQIQELKSRAAQRSEEWDEFWKNRRTYSPKKSLTVSLIVTAAFGFLIFYLYLPALNWQDPRLYISVGTTAGAFLVTRLWTSGEFNSKYGPKEFGAFWWKTGKLPSVIVAAVLAAALVGGAASNQLVASGAYHDLLPVESGDFAQDVYTISLDRIPTLDASSASTLGNRALGELADMVSQFEVESSYTQINYQGGPVRVASLKYGDIVKWFTNQENGLPGYVMVDMLTQKATVVRLDQPILYSPSERFGRDLMRCLRVNYPTCLFDTPHLEIDEDGTPYWICPRLEKTIGLFGGTDVAGAVILSAQTGESVYYDKADVPQWVDQVYSADLILQQYAYYGKYGKGFLNSLLGQNGVTQSTDGCNYLALNDDVYLYTGITSASSDDSTVGFILCNQRTKETKYYTISGATEQSAMNSAAGMVQDQSYTATFPLLLNISDQPTYFIALKDSADLVKMYAMVNVSQYQLVAVGSTIDACEQNYVALLRENGMEDVSSSARSSGETQPEVTGQVESVSSCVVDGDSIYFIKLTEGDAYYEVSAARFPQVAIVQPGDTLTFTCAADDTAYIRTALTVAFPWDS